MERSTVAALLRLSAMETNDWGTTLETILRVDSQTLGVDGVSYWTARPDPGCFFCELGYHAEADAFERGTVLEERFSPSYFEAVRKLQLIDVSDVANDPRTVELRAYLEERKIRSLLDVPIWLGGEPVGVLCHEHSGRIRTWTDGDKEFVLAVGQALVAALQNRERSRAEEAERSLAFLNGTAMVMSSTLDVSDAERIAVRRAIPKLGDAALIDVLIDGELHRSAIATTEEDTDTRLSDALRALPLSEGCTLLTATALRLQSSVFLPIVAHALRNGDLDPSCGRSLLDLGIRSAMAVPMRIAGRQTGAMAFLSRGGGYDQSDLRLAEEYVRLITASVENARLFRMAQNAIAVRDEFISLVSHELRTPLTPLRASAEAIASGLVDPKEVRRVADVLVRQVDRLERLAQRMVDASQINSGTLSIHPERIDLAHVVHDVAAGMSIELAKAGCTLELRLEEPTEGRWDPRRLRLVIANLIENAMKFGRGQPIEVEVQRGEDVAVVSVRDHGVGLPRTRLDDDEILVRHERGMPSQAPGGLGLGLFIVRHVVLAHGGTVRARGHREGGVIVTVELPYAPPRTTGRAGNGRDAHPHHRG